MNKDKLQTLLQQSREDAFQYGVRTGKAQEILFSQMWGQVFAESILKECFDIIERQAAHLEDEMEVGRADDLRSVSSIIKQHFGVERNDEN